MPPRTGIEGDGPPPSAYADPKIVQGLASPASHRVLSLSGSSAIESSESGLPAGLGSNGATRERCTSPSVDVAVRVLEFGTFVEAHEHIQSVAIVSILIGVSWRSVPVPAASRPRRIVLCFSWAALLARRSNWVIIRRVACAMGRYRNPDEGTRSITRCRFPASKRLLHETSCTTRMQIHS